MSQNQRLFLALGLSFAFFVVYTTIFPPKVSQENNATVQNREVSIKNGVQGAQQNSQQSAQVGMAEVGHTINSDERSSEGSTLVKVNSDKFEMKIDSLGRISSVILKEEKYRDQKDQKIDIISPYGVKPLFIRFADDNINTEAKNTPYSANVSSLDLSSGEGTIVLTQKLSNLVVTKKIKVYQDGHYDVNVELSDYKRYFIYLGERPQSNGEQMMTVKGAMVYDKDEIFTILEDGDVESRSSYKDVVLTSVFDQYFASIFYDLKSDDTIYIDRDRDDNPIVYVEGEAGKKSLSFKGYVGPKDYKQLNSIDPVLTNAIEYGWFTFVSAPLFKLLMWLHSILGNWGWAIVALTIIIRLLMYPLTYKGMVSMQKLKEISPKVKEIQAKYKGDPQRMNAAVMEMYKKHGANPLGGCLPMLLQIPVFFAIYRVLLNAVELQGAEWILWIDDLSKMDNYFILPILMGATMFYQQKITPNNFTDPLQEKVFKYLPVIFTFFFITFPSGLVLYWFVNNLASIGQQFMVNRSFKKAKSTTVESK